MPGLADDVHRTLTAAFVVLAEVCPGGELVRRGEVTGAFTGIPASFFNPVHVWRGDGDLRHHLEAVAARGDERRLPWHVVVPVGSAHEPFVEAFAAEHGLRPAERRAPGMALASLDGIPDLPADLAAEEVREPDGMATITALTADAFEMPPDLAQLISGPAFLARPEIHWLLLRRAGEPVATAMVLVADHVAGIFNVGVPAPHRRAGLGAAATWEAIRLGRAHGARVAVLEASDMGAPVYRRMGFETVTLMRSFAREGA